MRTMKTRLLCLLLSLLMLFGLMGCTAKEAGELLDAAAGLLFEETDDPAASGESAAPEAQTPAVTPAEQTAAPEEKPAAEAETPEPSEKSAEPEQTAAPGQNETDGLTVTEEGTYSDKEHVALYLHTFGHLPDNYLTKSEAESLGWVSSAGNLWEVAPGKSIGGDKFGNREGLLPSASGRKWYECDIDFDGGRRNAKRIVFSNDGLIYYTEDHYSTFTQLY